MVTPSSRRGGVAVDDSAPCEPGYSSSDSSAHSDGGVSLWPSMGENCQTRRTTIPKTKDRDDTAGSSRRFRPARFTSCRYSKPKLSRARPRRETNVGSRRRKRFHNSMKCRDVSNSRQVPRPSIAVSRSQPALLDRTTSFRPFNPSNHASSQPSLADSGCSRNATASSNTPILDRASENATPSHVSSQHHQPKLHQSRRFAYVEDANSDEETTSGDLYPYVTERRQVAADRTYMDSDQAPSEREQSKASREVKPSISPSRIPASLPIDETIESVDPFDDWDWNESDSESGVAQTHQRFDSSRSRTPLSPTDRSALSEDTKRKRFPRRKLRPRAPSSPVPLNPFKPNPTNHQQFIPHPYYAPPPPSYIQPEPYIRGYAPSAPGLSYERPPLMPYDTYGQYRGSYGAPGYPNYGQYQSTLPPRPPSPPNLESPSEPHKVNLSSERIVLGQNPKTIPNSAPIVNTTSLYKPPVSSDLSGRDIAFQIHLKSASTDNDLGKGKSVGFDFTANGEMSQHWEKKTQPCARDGESCLTLIRSLEHYADRSGQDRLTIMCPRPPVWTETNGVPVLRWLHLQQTTFCLDDLRKLVRDCQYLDEDFMTLADRLLEVECAKLEKKYSSGSNQGYYIEPGTVLRYDMRYDQEPSRGRQSVLFCSVPYLQLGKHEQHGNLDKKIDKHIHPIRTLMESLYDYDLLNDRDGRQAILQCSSEQDSILYVPQIWYLLCGSDVLISCSHLSLMEICGDLIQVRTESNRSLIAVVTDPDNNQFSVALKTTDSYFSAIDQIEALRPNVGGNTVDDYDLVLENDEHLIPKNWLDIVARDPLPLLKITLKFRSKTDRELLALTIKGGKFRPGGEDTANSSASDEDSERAHQPEPRWPTTSKKSQGHTYTLNSFKGAVTEEKLKQSNESSTLLSNLDSRVLQDRRRIQALESHGMVVNDITLIRNEPEIFTLPKPNSPPKLVVWDYLVDDWKSNCQSQTGRSGVKQSVVGKDDDTPMTQPDSLAEVDKKRLEAAENCSNSGELDIDQDPQPPEELRQHRERRRPIMPFLQWDDNEDKDIVVRRVLDQVNDRLSRNSSSFKIYKISRASTLKDLQDREGPLHGSTDSMQTDEILSFRGKTAEKRTNQLFQSSKDLVAMFIPTNFDHDVTRKIWGAVYTICQASYSLNRVKVMTHI
ncbi:hypothetical protein GGR55DRAFT_257174 [Xylaria sp. FL0064]|nr:hypothetical protein GGR55DRAFT_257174 [Xylaria sp. FL0064]